jgi:hypothetical protein
MTSSFEDGNKISVSIKGGKFVGYLINSYLLKKDCAPWITL